MDDPLRYCIECLYWEPCSATEGKCRRYAPAAVLCANAGENGPTASWPWTLAQDWCGEWRAREGLLPQEEPPLNPEEERSLRNASIAEALLVLPADKRDRLLLEVLTDEERQCPTPPVDFYERVQEYLARQQDGDSEQGA
ncbi:MAG: hypothetical protein JXA87_10265 [Thermoleophilia bacterium]|nr:hypothetical protein [Thermoleophilia bacterium]